MKRIGVTGIAALAAAAVAGCSSGSGVTATPGTRASSTAATSASPAASGPAASSPGSGTTAASSKCGTKDLALQVIQGPQEEGSTTGSFYVQLTNTSGRTCTLFGFPGVELIGGVGGTPKPLGMKDVWSAKLTAGGGEKAQTLAPHAARAAFVNFGTRDPGASADVPRASEVKVIPPDQTTALTGRIYNVDAGYVTPLVTTKTLTVGPVDIDAVPHN